MEKMISYKCFACGRTVLKEKLGQSEFRLYERGRGGVLISHAIACDYLTILKAKSTRVDQNNSP